MYVYIQWTIHMYIIKEVVDCNRKVHKKGWHCILNSYWIIHTEWARPTSLLVEAPLSLLFSFSFRRRDALFLWISTCTKWTRIKIVDCNNYGGTVRTTSIDTCMGHTCMHLIYTHLWQCQLKATGCMVQQSVYYGVCTCIGLNHTLQRRQRTIIISQRHAEVALGSGSDSSSQDFRFVVCGTMQCIPVSGKCC